jgi:hypothetical protein
LIKKQNKNAQTAIQEAYQPQVGYVYIYITKIGGGHARD